jgi:hypothetical protein
MESLMHAYQRWRDTIQAAADEAAILSAMRTYTATLPSPIVAALPDECRSALDDPDIQGAALTLLQSALSYSGDPAFAELLHEIAETFAVASARISELGQEPPGPPG